MVILRPCKVLMTSGVCYCEYCGQHWDYGDENEITCPEAPVVKPPTFRESVKALFTGRRR